jgi:hypothetical protein
MLERFESSLAANNSTQDLTRKPFEVTELYTSGEPKYSHWHVDLDGKALCSMVGEPMTHDEALQAARHKWPNANVMHAQTLKVRSIF